MTEQPKYEPCGHCGGTGTCRNAENGSSCAVCARRFVLFKYSPSHGLVCSICKGTGFIEPISLRLSYRTGHILAIVVMSTAIVTAIFGFKEHFSEVLTFLGTLTGAISGFYFSRKK